MTRLFEPRLDDLRDTILRMGSRCEAILAKSLRSLWTRDTALADEVAEDDLEIDRLDVDVDDAVLKALALGAPLAEDLRKVVAIKMIATDLERVGDLARNIASSSHRLADVASLDLPEKLRGLAELTQKILRDALDSLADLNAAEARAVIEGDDAIDTLQDEMVREEIARMDREPATAAGTVDLILIAENLERVGDHATNIAEEVVLMAEARNLKHAAKLGRSG
jgi:phosphate transport system protein